MRRRGRLADVRPDAQRVGAGLRSAWRSSCRCCCSCSWPATSPIASTAVTSRASASWPKRRPSSSMCVAQPSDGMRSRPAAALRDGRCCWVGARVRDAVVSRRCCRTSFRLKLIAAASARGCLGPADLDHRRRRHWADFSTRASRRSRTARSARCPAAAVVLMTLHPHARSARAHVRAADARVGVRRAARSSARRRSCLGAISLDLFAVLLGGATALLPIYARDILMIGPWGLGLLRTAPAVGALSCRS